MRSIANGLLRSQTVNIITAGRPDRMKVNFAGGLGGYGRRARLPSVLLQCASANERLVHNRASGQGGPRTCTNGTLRQPSRSKTVVIGVMQLGPSTL